MKDTGKLDNLIYRFRKCNEHSFDALFNNSITFVSLNNFNDSMECYIPCNKEEVYKQCIKTKKFIRSLINYEKRKVTLADLNSKEIKELCYEDACALVTSPLYKNEALKYINSYIRVLFNELRKSFLVASFTDNGAHPVMWSHYSDDSSGFVCGYNREIINRNFFDYCVYTYPDLTSFERKIHQMHKVSYGVQLDCTSFVCDILKHSFRTNKISPNKFMNYASKSRENANKIIYLLTNKMTEWSYENEYRLIFPRSVVASIKIYKNTASEILNDFKNIVVGNPEVIIAGDKIKNNNLAALAYYCNVLKRKRIDLMITKPTFSLVEQKALNLEYFKDNMLNK